MHKPAYLLRLGATTIDSTVDKVPQVVELAVMRDMDVPIDILNVNLAGINQLKAQKGDGASLELGNNGTLVQVMAGKVEDVSLTFTGVVVSVVGIFSQLVHLRVDKVYLESQAGDIVRDLAQQAGIDVAEAQAGINFPSYTVNRGKNAYEHCHELAGKCGFDLYCNAERKLVFKKFIKTRGDHTLTYGIDVLSIDAFREAPFYDGVTVYGESPASLQGADTWNWFTKDFSNSSGSAGEKGGLLIQDPSIRVREAAATYAEAKLAWSKRMSVSGRATVLGKPEVKLGDAIEIKDCPNQDINGTFQIRSVRHLLNKEEGFVSEIGFCGLAK
jgi:phage protein D